MTDKVLRIGGASGFWSDAARARDDRQGYALDFISAAMKPNLGLIARRGIKVVSNAGGVNPQACAAALRSEIAAQSLDLKVACVVGDDLMDKAPDLRDSGVIEMFSGETFPEVEELQSINAYLGDFSTASLQQVGENRVKVNATYADQFRGGTYMTFYGIDADRKARALGEAVLAASREIFKTLDLANFSETSIELIGAESQYGAFTEVDGSREVAMKLAAKHPEGMGIGIMLKEAVGLGLATPPGLCGFAGSRPKPSPVVRLFSFTVARDQVKVQILMDSETIDCDEVHGEALDAEGITRPAAPAPGSTGEMTDVPLVALAWGRSGDKGNKANIGIIARQPDYLPYICAALTEQVVSERFAHFLSDTAAGNVERFLLSGSHSINFLMHDVLGGGGVASIRNDAQGKGYAQLLLSCPIPVPTAVAEKLS